MNRLNAYYEIFASVEASDYDTAVDLARKKLDQLFVQEYYAQFSNAEIVEFVVNGYTYLFALDTSSSSSESQNDDRIVGVYGSISTSDKERDRSRMQGFIGPFSKIESYKGYDKGHFVAHKINGGLDQNLYPQLKELNRGWSEEGKLFRSLERYCEINPETFMFTRPIYTNDTWIPTFLDYGVFTRQGGLLLNRFNNSLPST